MTVVVWRGIATALAVAALTALAAALGPTVPVWLVVGSAAMLIPFAVVDWWAVAIGVVVHRRRPEVEEVLGELDHMVRTASGGTAVAILGISFLLGGLLPRGAGFMLLVMALVLFSGRPLLFLWRYYRK